MEHIEKKRDARLPDSVESARKIISQDAFHYYRGLVGQIEISLPHHSSRTLLFTSSLGREGTTEVVMGLALTLAGAMGRPTAVVDCNVRDPEVHRRFGVDNVGLDDYLRGNVRLEDALLNTLVPNLYVMPLGRGLTSLAAIKKDQFGALIALLKGRFEYVLLDSAAVGVDPEATMLCEMADAVVLVVKHGGTRREVARRTKEMIERAGGRVLGVVLNKRRFPIPEFLYRRL
jgi:capsular exopolysaccharide synthesis family protein